MSSHFPSDIDKNKRGQYRYWVIVDVIVSYCLPRDVIVCPVIQLL